MKELYYYLDSTPTHSYMRAMCVPRLFMLCVEMTWTSPFSLRKRRTGPG